MPRTSRAFTLIELLVVIAIIAVLISIMLPALGGAKEMAKQTKCNSNLRNLITACHLYAGDFEEHMPMPNWDARSDGWLYTGLITAVVHQRFNYGPSSGLIWPYLDGPPKFRDGIKHQLAQVYRCPSHTEPWDSGPSEKITSYLMNGAVSGYGRQRKAAYRISQFLPQSVILWEAQEAVNTPARWNDGSSYPWEGLTDRHGKGATVAIIDGSCIWYNRSQWDQDLLLEPGPLWCNPGTKNGR